MKNKLNQLDIYQYALNNIVKSCCPNCHDNNGCFNCNIKESCNATAKNWVDRLQSLIDILREYNVTQSNIRKILLAGNQFEELLDKDIPEKPIIERFRESEHYICPNCKKHRFGILGYGEYKNEFRKNSNFTPYCPNCGQRLDWSDTNE